MADSDRVSSTRPGVPRYRPPENPHLRTLYRPLYDDAMAEVRLALKVAVLLQVPMPRNRIAVKLGVPQAEVDRAVARLRRIRDRIDNGD